MKLSLLTYNTLYNMAFSKLPDILKKYKPDIVCLQEIDTNDDNLKKMEDYGYSLADYANCFFEFGKIWGVATYYKAEKFEFLNSKPIPLINGIYELIKLIIRMFRNKGLRRTILKTNLKIKKTNSNITIYNLHLSAIGLNNLRLKQINMIDFEEVGQKGSIILTGDFNFPVERKKLEKIMNKYNLKEATNNLLFTVKYPNSNKPWYSFLYRLFSKIARKLWTDEVKLDYIFYRGLKNTLTKRVDVNFSDHFPIYAEFDTL